MSEAKIYHASCLCSKIKFTIQGEPFHYAICNCRNCKQASGSAFSSQAFFQPSQIKVTQGKENITKYADGNNISGNVITRSFCATCGGRLFVKPAKEGILLVHPSLVEETVTWMPKMEFHCEERLSWVKDLSFDS